MSYVDKFVRKPKCFGEEYDGEDSECLRECSFREDCYKEWSHAYYVEEARKPARFVRAGGKSAPSTPARPTQYTKPLEVLSYNEVLPFVDMGEPWHSRLGWNMVSGALSAMGLEVHVFFKHFRFPPKPKSLPPYSCNSCTKGAEGD